MAAISLKNLPDTLVERIRARAVADRRSMTQEVVYLLEQALSDPAHTLATRQQQEAALQVEAWSRLAGQWQSDRTSSEDFDPSAQSQSG